jgi:hypothetical protein
MGGIAILQFILPTNTYCWDIVPEANQKKQNYRLPISPGLALMQSINNTRVVICGLCLPKLDVDLVETSQARLRQGYGG